MSEQLFEQDFESEYKTVMDSYATGETAPVGFAAVLVDYWKLEATTTEHQELWWPVTALCECGGEAALSYNNRYYCRKHFVAPKPEVESVR